MARSVSAWLLQMNCDCLLPHFLKFFYLCLLSAFQSSLIALVEPKEDFSDLAPNQRRKKLQQRLDEINTRLLQETATRDGLMKMKGVYEQNRALGDPLSIEGQLTESGQRYLKPNDLFDCQLALVTQETCEPRLHFDLGFREK